MARRRLLIDLRPLRHSRDFRYLIGGQSISVLGTQLTAVAVPFQVYELTRSSLDVGLVSLAQLVPLLLCSFLGGSIIDATDRKRVLVIVELMMAASTCGLAVNADVGPHLWPLFVFPAVTAGLSGIDSPTRASIFPNLLPTELISSASAMFQALFQMGSVVGPAIAGLLLAGAGVHFVYWVDVTSTLGAVVCALFISSQPPSHDAARASFRSIAEGFRFLKGRQPMQGAYLIDINAMVFGMPRALFPALAATTFGGGTAVLGFLYAAPGAGALVGALTTGWVTAVRRQGRAVTIAVLVWGAAITAFGLVHWLPAALILLAVAGWADVISAVFRSTILQLTVPDELRGRLNAVQTGVVAGGPRLGDLESGAVATAFTNEISIVSGGLLCVVGAVALVRALPGFRRVEVDAVAGTAVDPRLGPAIEDD
jgi:hypothetical protein